ncbi:MAG: hypothetical protein KAG64_04920 [Bacteroidales bacterium]|nr:hypothetical protein [Bacteroidales bacterium]
MYRITVILGFVLFINILQNPTFGQENDFNFEMADSLIVDSSSAPIDDYNKYTPMLGGEKIRIKDGLKFNGRIKDYYPDSSIKHNGYYQNGQLISSYKNYYPNGQLERSYAISGTFKLTIKSYYSTGKPKEYIEYRKDEIVKFIEYYPNGNKASIEEHDKRNGCYTLYENYYPDGKLMSSLELLSRKKWSYYQKDYFSSGKVKEEGPVQYNKFQYDYQRNGIWKEYNELGALIETKEYYKGEVIL